MYRVSKITLISIGSKFLSNVRYVKHTNFPRIPIFVLVYRGAQMYVNIGVKEMYPEQRKKTRILFHITWRVVVLT